jgi:hypothetical protein
MIFVEARGLPAVTRDRALAFQLISLAGRGICFGALVGW